MSHSWDSPARLARDVLSETLESRLDDAALRKEVIDLAIEEFDTQLADPDDEMIEAGLIVLAENDTFAARTSTYRRRLTVERIWRAMAERAFDR